jgi:hypothetical protein
MLGKIMGAMIGRSIDRSDGRGGMKGLMLGALAGGAMRRMGPLGLALGGAYMAKKAMDRRRGRY